MASACEISIVIPVFIERETAGAVEADPRVRN
jgi:hypothetical protein